MNSPNCMPGSSTSGSREVDEFDPVRVLAHRVFLQLGELAGRWIDRVARQAVGELADREQVAPRRIDLEAPRLLFGRHTADRRQGAGRQIDAEAGERARRALRAVEELSVGRDVQIGGRRLAGEAGRQRADRLLLLQIAGGGVLVEDAYRPVELAEHAADISVRVIDEVARAESGI